jgi:hypothetical protein
MFIREQKIKNKNGSVRTYLQICESARVDGKPRPVVLMNLGRIDNEEGKDRVESLARLIIESSKVYSFLNVESDIETEWSKNYGYPLIFSKLWHELGLGDVIANAASVAKTDFDIADVAYNMTLNRLHSPRSKRQLERWQDSVYGINHYDTHQYYRAMDRLAECQDAIEKSLFTRMRLLHEQKVDIVLFDTTTLVYYGEGEDGEKLLARGFSKAKRGDLKQVVIGVVMSQDGIPLAHEVFSGNKNDVTCFKEIIDKISKKFSVKKVILVGVGKAINRISSTIHPAPIWHMMGRF